MWGGGGGQVGLVGKGWRGAGGINFLTSSGAVKFKEQRELPVCTHEDIRQVDVWYHCNSGAGLLFESMMT